MIGSQEKTLSRFYGAFVILMTNVAGITPIVGAQGERAFSSANAPEEEKLTTKDGVRLGVTFYPSNRGKEAVPIVMLHDVDENRAIYHRLARALQASSGGNAGGHAVLTVDLRGHGESTTVMDAQGNSQKIDGSRLKNRDYQAMVRYDMEAVRKFLVTKNDEGQLNLNKLVVLGSGLGANVAVAWTAADWSAPRLPHRKQGQDVKAMILASPKWSWWGLPLLKSLRHPGVRQSVAMLLVYGEQDSRATKDAKTIFKNLEKYHNPPKRGKVPELILHGTATRLQGTKLLVNPEFGSFKHLHALLDAHVVNKEFEWLRRRSAN